MAWALQFDGVNDCLQVSGLSANTLNIKIRLGADIPALTGAWRYIYDGRHVSGSGWLAQDPSGNLSESGCSSPKINGLPVGSLLDLFSATSGDVIEFNAQGSTGHFTIGGRYTGTDTLDLLLVDMDVHDVTLASQAAFYDATASDHSNTGSQPVLVDTIGSNNATGAGFATDGSAWVDLGGGSIPVAVSYQSILSFNKSVLVEHQATLNLLNKVNIEQQSLIELFKRYNTEQQSQLNFYGRSVTQQTLELSLLRNIFSDYQINFDLLSQTQVISGHTLLLDLNAKVIEQHSVIIDGLQKQIANYDTVIELVNSVEALQTVNLDFFTKVEKSFQINIDALSQNSVVTPQSLLIDMQGRINREFTSDLSFLEVTSKNQQIVTTLLNQVAHDFSSQFDLLGKKQASYTISLDYIGRLNANYDIAFSIQSDNQPKTPAHYVVNIGDALDFSAESETLHFTESVNPIII